MTTSAGVGAAQQLSAIGVEDVDTINLRPSFPAPPAYLAVGEQFDQLCETYPGMRKWWKYVLLALVVYVIYKRQV